MWIFSEDTQIACRTWRHRTDEFHDTNRVQCDPMRLFAGQRRKVTVVGGPDQSIYGFCSAEVRNYYSLLRQYPDTLTISLEESYRSSGAVLKAALGVIQQDGSRPLEVKATLHYLRVISNPATTLLSPRWSTCLDAALAK